MKHKDKEGTRKLVDREMHSALDSAGKGEVAYDSESDTEVPHPFSPPLPLPLAAWSPARPLCKCNKSGRGRWPMTATPPLPSTFQLPQSRREVWPTAAL